MKRHICYNVGHIGECHGSFSFSRIFHTDKLWENSNCAKLVGIAFTLLANANAFISVYFNVVHVIRMLLSPRFGDRSFPFSPMDERNGCVDSEM